MKARKQNNMAYPPSLAWGIDVLPVTDSMVIGRVFPVKPVHVVLQGRDFHSFPISGQGHVCGDRDNDFIDPRLIPS
jgi:hypothetical protein